MKHAHRLTKTVFVSGHSFLGITTTCTIHPLVESGIFFKLPNGEKVPLSSMSLGVNTTFHFLTLAYGAYQLNIPEHLLGMLYAVGLDKVMIELPKPRLPYSRGAKIYWDALKKNVVGSGYHHLCTPRQNVTVENKRGGKIEFTPGVPGCEKLTYEIFVSYPELGEMTLTGVVGDANDFAELFSARSYMRTRAHRFLAQTASEFLNWPHTDIAVYKESDSEEARQAVLRELCFHRLLDLLGALMHVCPKGNRIVGHMKTRFTGHEGDVELVQKMRPMGFLVGR